MKIQDLLTIYAKSPQAGALAKVLEDSSVKSVFLQGLVASSAPVLFASVADRCRQTVLFVLQDADEAGYFYHDLTQMLGQESVDRLQEKIAFKLHPGAFAENILCEGICLYQLPVGTRLRIGTALCEVTQIGKECHADCAIRRQAGDCVMPREGIFVIVLEEGEAKPGDTIEVLTE